MAGVTDSRRPPLNTKHTDVRFMCWPAQALGGYQLTSVPLVLSKRATWDGPYTAKQCSSEDTAIFLLSDYLCGNQSFWNSFIN